MHEVYEESPMQQWVIDWFKEQNKWGKNVERPWVWIGPTMAGDATASETYGYGIPNDINNQVLDDIPVLKSFKVPYIKDQTPILSQRDVIRFWAYSKFCFEAVSNLVDP